MSKKTIIASPPVPACDTEKAPAKVAVKELAGDTGVLASIKQAKDFVVDKLSNPQQTATELKDWAERSARKVDVALEATQDALSTVHGSIGQAREWTADKAAQIDNTLATAQDIVVKLDDTVEAVQDSTVKVADSLQGDPVFTCAPPAATGKEMDSLVAIKVEGADASELQNLPPR